MMSGQRLTPDAAPGVGPDCLKPVGGSFSLSTVRRQEPSAGASGKEQLPHHRSKSWRGVRM